MQKIEEERVLTLREKVKQLFPKEPNYIKIGEREELLEVRKKFFEGTTNYGMVESLVTFLYENAPRDEIFLGCTTTRRETDSEIVIISSIFWPYLHFELGGYPTDIRVRLKKSAEEQTPEEGREVEQRFSKLSFVDRLKIMEGFVDFLREKAQSA